MTFTKHRLVTLLAIVAAWTAFASSASATAYTWSGGSETADQWTNKGYWTGGSIAATAGTYTTRLNVSGASTLIYSAAQGYTVYTAADSDTWGRSLAIGNGANGSMSITGGTWSSTGSGGDIVGNGSGSGVLSIDGGVYINTSGAGSLLLGYAGGTGTLNVNSGTVAIANVQISTGGNGGTGTVNLNGGILSVGGITDAGSTSVSTVNLNGGTLQARASNTSFMTGLDQVYVQSGGAIIDTQGYSITIGNALLAGAGSGGLTKSGGTGTLILAGANTYTGLTAVNIGVLNIQNNTALGSTAGSTTVASGAALQLQGGITVTGEALSIAGNGIGSDGVLRSISGNNTWAGTITAGSTSTNRIACDSGLLTISGNISLTGTVAYQLSLQGNGNILITGNISGGSNTNVTLFKSSYGNGTVILAGNNTYVGSFTSVGNGTLQIGNGGTTGNLCAGSVALSNGATLAFNRSDAYSFGDIISGSGSVAQIGVGTLTLGAANTYTGTTTVKAGTLNVTGSLANNGYSSVILTALGTVSTGSAATIIRAVASGTALAAYGSTGVGNLTTHAQILGGTTSTGVSSLSMSWRDATAAERRMNASMGIISEVLTLTGVNTDKYGLSLTYDTNALTSLGSSETSGIYVAWYDSATSSWDKISTGVKYDSYSDSLLVGSWGIDTTTNTIWVVTDKTGSFAIVPEPGTLAMLVGALLGLIAYAWRKRK